MNGTTLIRVLALSLGAAVIAMTVIVFYAYLIAWRRTRASNTGGLLPLHVMAVSAYTILQSVAGALTILMLIDEGLPLGVIGPLQLVANATLVVGLIIIFRYQRRRVRFTTVDTLAQIAEVVEPTELYKGRR